MMETLAPRSDRTFRARSSDVRGVCSSIQGREDLVTAEDCRDAFNLDRTAVADRVRARGLAGPVRAGDHRATWAG